MGCKKNQCDDGIHTTRETGKDKHGRSIWATLMNTCASLQCSICADSCKRAIQSQRDRISLHKGGIEAVYDKENLISEANYWECTRKKLQGHKR